ncbi:MAG TPA: GGDEF domain-containing protein [Gaiellaceae bacterium]|nr:GGDEF domain-containing protein [Gaiellaceae bacterium]
MEPLEATVPDPWSSATAAEIAEAAGADDLFVFRRVAEGRFAHLGGSGRGAGWAGIVEIGVDEEPLLAAMLADETVLRRSQREPWHVLGPYYAPSVAAVSVSADVFVVFGAGTDAFSSLSDGELLALARHAGETLFEVSPAKRLADELEAMNAVRDLLQTSAETFDEALRWLVDRASVSLSCDLGLAYIHEGRRVQIADHRGGPRLGEEEVTDALASIGQWSSFPVCVQRASAVELPEPFRAEDGVIAYYLLEIGQPLPGFLLLLHTRAGTARGFTQLCQSLGRKLVDAGEPLLATALLRETMRAELEKAEVAARRDPLTALPNRLAWTEAIASASVGPETPVSIIKLDCRGLKQINDTHGHEAGDRVLCRVAGILIDSVRATDVAARLGGDEFSILLGGADADLAAIVVGRIERALENESWPEGPRIGLAIGSATTYENLEAAERQADASMLESKRLNRRSTQASEAARPI